MHEVLRYLYLGDSTHIYHLYQILEMISNDEQINFTSGTSYFFPEYIYLNALDLFFSKK